MRTIVLGLLVCGGVACTTPTTTSPDGSPRAEPATVRYRGIRFDVACMPVAEALVDIELPHRGQPMMRAIAGLWDHQAVAVLANDPNGCGLWTLALASGLTEATRTRIQQETTSGVEAFGVTASPVPRSEGHGQG